MGQGISAHIDGIGFVKVGKPAYCELTLPDNMPQIWQIASIVAVSVDDNPIGAFALADSLKRIVCKRFSVYINIILMW